MCPAALCCALTFPSPGRYAATLSLKGRGENAPQGRGSAPSPFSP
ncbi:MAG: hypothetical protein JWQ89_3530 [Devosia sp.]|nr:hypothetical protein [Devosia sp.]